MGLFPEIASFRAERGIVAAMTAAARQERCTWAEWARRRIRKALVDVGVPLPPMTEAAAAARSHRLEQPQ
jgi:hypothetical protein